MPRRMLNLGILAHVDAGKTTLTERLLYLGGVIDEVGSVDAGTTQTDSLDLERQRGITIKSAVVSFAVGDATVNLIDTPGHPDFIAEVERALSVLDGAVLVISAVEGVQPQTRILMRALQRMGIPAVMFVNKIDRRGAGYDPVLEAIAHRLTPAIVAMGSVSEIGTRAAGFRPCDESDAGFAARLAEVLAEQDDSVLAAYVDSEDGLPYRRLRRTLTAQTARGAVHPVFFGSALTGAGVPELMRGITELLPATSREAGGPVCGRVFKIERGAAGEKIAYARMFSGVLQVRQKVAFGQDREGKVTGINVFAGGSSVRRDRVGAGEIGMLRGLTEIQVGDGVGMPGTQADEHQFAPPTLETVVRPRHRGDKGALHAALTQLAEQDPLINIRQDDVRGEIYLSLYGEVQKEVIEATLARDYGLAATFRETTTIYAERPIGTGAAAQRLRQAPNPFVATVGLRIEPADPGSGVHFRLEVEPGSMPIAFFRATEDTVRKTLRQGIYGWEVIDCTVTMTHSGFLARHSIGHARFTKSISSTGEDFRKLAPLVLMDALKQARTVVCEPIHHFRLDAPADVLPDLLAAMSRLRATPKTQVIGDASLTLEGDMPVAGVHELRQQLPNLTRGEGVAEISFDRYEAVSAPFPTRPRIDNNPLNWEEYLKRLANPAAFAGIARREPGSLPW